jgi:hypothetical protein
LPKTLTGATDGEGHFGLVFLGIESVQEKEPPVPAQGDIREKTETAIRLLPENGIAVLRRIHGRQSPRHQEDMGGFARERLKVDLAVVVRYPLLRPDSGKIARRRTGDQPDDLSRYTGFMCNVRTRHLPAQLNRILNWRTSNTFSIPWFRDNNFVRKREKGPSLLPRVMLNNLEYITGWFMGNRIPASWH